jgi:hypothetical protein
MDLPDFDEPFDPDFVSVVKTWAKVPEPIRKNVEQHVAAHLPAIYLRSFVTCTPVECPSVLIRRSSILAAAWPSGTCAENG